MDAYQLMIYNEWYERNLKKMEKNIGYSVWDDGTYIVTINKTPVGPAMTEKEIEAIVRWLRDALPELLGGQ